MLYYFYVYHYFQQRNALYLVGKGNINAKYTTIGIAFSQSDKIKAKKKVTPSIESYLTVNVSATR